MIDDINAHDLAGLYEPPCQFHIIAAGHRIARGMVVEQNDGRSARRCRLSKDLSRMCRAGIKRADRNHRCPDEPVFRVEHHQPELLNRTRSELRKQVGGCIARIDELEPGRGATQQRATSQLDRGEHLGGFRTAHAVEVAQLVDGCTRYPVESARGFKDVIREGEGICPARSTADDNGDELVVAKTGRAETTELLARAIVRRQGFYGHDILKVDVASLGCVCRCSSLLDVSFIRVLDAAHE